MNVIIQAQNLTLSYPVHQDKLTILDNIAITLHEGQSMALRGSSGAGKTSLLMIMGGLLRPNAGSVNIYGHNIAMMSEQEAALIRRQYIGIVFQQFHLMPHLTALENVLVPLLLQPDSNNHDKALSMLKRVGLDNRYKHFPHQLSGGEQQRVALARALVNRPKFILADEPTGNLDEQTGEQVSDLLLELVDEYQASLLLVTHDSILANKMQQQYFLSHGTLHMVAP